MGTLDFLARHWFGVVVYVVIHLALYYLFMVVLSKKHVKFHKNKEVLEKFEPFNRIDVDNWTLANTLPGVLLFLPRMLLWILNSTLYTIVFSLITIDLDKEKDTLKGGRRKLMRMISNFLTRFSCFIAGIVWIDVDYVAAGEGDYSKWLGPDWKPEWNRAGAVILNHHCWMDILLGIYLFFPSFVAKKSTKEYPFVRKMAPLTDSIFIERAGTKEERIAAVKQIGERMKDNEISNRPPLLMFPEGATTNNLSLI